MHARLAGALCVLGATLMSGGCLLPGTPVTVSELPPQLQAIADDPNSFLAPADDPLANITPGTPIDDLSELTGCWGTYGAGELLEDGSRYDVFYEAYQFDADAGTVNRWVFTAAWLFVPPVVVIDEGTYRVLDDGRIEIQVDRWTLVDLDTGVGRRFEDLPELVSVTEKLITLDDDQILLGVPWFVDEQTGQPAGRIFRRFDCPQ